MAEHRNYIAVIGRLHGDDDDHPRLYEHTTVSAARQAFINDVRRDEGIKEADVVAGYECTNVYIGYVLTSDSPINIEEH